MTQLINHLADRVLVEVLREQGLDITDERLNALAVEPVSDLENDDVTFEVDFIVHEGRAVLAAAFVRSRSDGLDAWRMLGPEEEARIVATAVSLLSGTGPRSIGFNAELEPLTVRNGFAIPYLGPDAWFAAVGLSPQHLLAEALGRPTDFGRRVGRGRRGSGKLLGVAMIKATDISPGLSAVRRLAGFHSVSPDRGGERVVAFVHTDPAMLQHSLDLARGFSASGQLLPERYELLGYASTHSLPDGSEQWS